METVRSLKREAVGPGKKGTAAFDLIAACARRTLPARHADRVCDLVAFGDLDWNEVLRAAAFHGVLPIVQHHLNAAAGDLLPEQVKSYFREYQRTAKMRNAFQVQELANVVNTLDRQGIPTLVMKGPVLAHYAYGDVNLRQFGDLDILIPASSFARAVAVLKEEGYVPFQKLADVKGLRKWFYLYLSGQWPLKRAQGVFNLDLHTRIMPPGYSLPADFDRYWERSRAIHLEGASMRGFAPEDLLVVLCYHGIKNQWRLLKHVADVGALIDSTPTLCWEVVVERAEAARGRRVLLLGLMLAHRVMGVPVPSGLRWDMMRDPEIVEVASILIASLHSGGQTGGLDPAQRGRLQLAMQDSFSSRAKYVAYSMMRHVWSSLLKPGKPDNE